MNALDDGEGEVFLYDNVNDPYQLVKLKLTDRPEVAEKMLKELGQLLAKTKNHWYQERRYKELVVYPD